MLIKGDLDEAAEAFEMGLQKVATEYGELSDNCAEAYHLYGSTLLRIAKRDASIFSESGGGAEAGEDEDGDGDEEGDGENVMHQSSHMSPYHCHVLPCHMFESHCHCDH